MSEQYKEIISFGDYYEYFTVLYHSDSGKYKLRKTREDEGTTEEERTKEEVVWLMTWKDFTPSKTEILRLEDIGLLDEWLVAIRLYETGI